MTGTTLHMSTTRHMRSKARSRRHAMGAAAWQQLRTLIPPMTPKVILRALLGVLLFICGIVFGIWLIVRTIDLFKATRPERMTLA